MQKKFRPHNILLIIILITTCLTAGSMDHGSAGLTPDQIITQEPNANITVDIQLRDVPDQVLPGSRIEITADIKNTGTTTITPANATITLPVGASLQNYEWNTMTQPINKIGAMLAAKDLPASPPLFYAFGSDDFAGTVEDMQGHLQAMDDQQLIMSSYIQANALYYDLWDPELTAFYGKNLSDYMKSKNYELASHSYHHSHMGTDLHMDSRITGEPSRRYKRGYEWGICNTDQEEMMEVTLGKFWNEIYFNRRMEGFRNPFLEYDIPVGQEYKTKTPQRSSMWKILGKAGFRYASSIVEAPNPYNSGPLTPTNPDLIDPRSCVPAWPLLCDEVSVAAGLNDPYTDFSHNIYQIPVGSQRLIVDNRSQYALIYDDYLQQYFTYPDMMNFYKRYVDRHFQTTQTDVPAPYINGLSGSSLSQKNIPVTFGMSSSFTNSGVDNNGNRNNDWVYDINNYIKTTYPSAENITHKDILDYYTGTGTVRWIIDMPTTPGSYTFEIEGPGGVKEPYTVSVKSSEHMYYETNSRVFVINNAAEIAGLTGQGYTDVLFTVKGETGSTDLPELNNVIHQASANGLGVYCEISVFKDTGMHTTVTLDYKGNVVQNIAEPTDNNYRNALKSLLASLSTMNIKGIILDAEMPSDHRDGPTFGYSNAMIYHFEKYFGTPPAGSDWQDPTSETDPLYWSIYSSACTDDWRATNIEWLYYDIRQLADTYFTTGDMSNLGYDNSGTRVIDWLICKSPDASDYTGVSSWDEWEAWGEFRSYMIADFINEIASGSTKPVYAMVKGEKDVNALMKNSRFGTNTDPVELAAITRRPNILPDLWNQDKTDNLSGIIYDIDATTEDYVKACVETARRIDYWVAKGGNTNNGMMPVNEYRPLNDTKVFGTYIDTRVAASDPYQALRNAGSAVNGGTCAITIVNGIGPHVPYNIAVGKPIYASGALAQYPAIAANDGKDTTIWGVLATQQKQQWIYIDLKKQIHIESIKLAWFDKYYPTHYKIAVSNDLKNWTMLDKYKTTPGTDEINAGVPTQYVGILCVTPNDIGYGLQEFEILAYYE